MSERRLAKFTVAGAGGQIVVINPDYVRRITRQNDKTVSINLGDGDPIRVEGDIDYVAKLLGGCPDHC